MQAVSAAAAAAATSDFLALPVKAGAADVQADDTQTDRQTDRRGGQWRCTYVSVAEHWGNYYLSLSLPTS